MRDADRDPLRLSEDAAHRLIARAVELDARRASELSVDQLREAALEAGISPAAFEAALSESQAMLAHATGPGAPAAPAEPPPGRLTRLWRRLRERGETAPPHAWWEPVLANLVALLAFWGVLVLLVQLCLAADAEWQLRKAADVVALVLGAGVAHRLRAGLAKYLLAGLGVAQAAELAMDLVSGVPAVQGAGAHFALMIAGIAGVGLGALLTRTGRARTGPDAAAAAPADGENAVGPTPSATQPGDAWRRLLRLRHA